MKDIDLDIEPSRAGTGQSRDRGDRGSTKPRRAFSKVDGVVRDVAAFRAVAYADLVTQQFNGHRFAARQGIAEAEREGWIERRTAEGPEGGSFTVVVATSPGHGRATRVMY